MTAPDLGPATSALAALVTGVRDDQMTAPTPCTEYAVGDLVDHIGGLTLAFTGAARKEQVPGSEQGGTGDASRLEPGWRDRIANDLAALAEAWRAEEAHHGMTQAGPVELPGEVAALVTLNEVVVHGWDLAVATGQPYRPDPALVAACAAFVDGFEVGGDGPFGPPLPPPADATPMERLAAGTGRDPRWSRH